MRQTIPLDKYSLFAIKATIESLIASNYKNYKRTYRITHRFLHHYFLDEKQHLILAIKILFILLQTYHHVVLIMYIASILHYKRIILYMVCYTMIPNNKVIVCNMYNSWNILYFYWNGLYDNQSLFILITFLYTMGRTITYDVIWKCSLMVFVIRQQWYYVLYLSSNLVFNHYYNRLLHDSINELVPGWDDGRMDTISISISYAMVHYYYPCNAKDKFAFYTCLLSFWIQELHILHNSYYRSSNYKESSTKNDRQLVCIKDTVSCNTLRLYYDTILRYYDRLQWFHDYTLFHNASYRNMQVVRYNKHLLDYVTCVLLYKNDINDNEVACDTHGNDEIDGNATSVDIDTAKTIIPELFQNDTDSKQQNKEQPKEKEQIATSAKNDLLSNIQENYIASSDQSEIESTFTIINPEYYGRGIEDFDDVHVISMNESIGLDLDEKKSKKNVFKKWMSKKFKNV